MIPNHVLAAHRVQADLGHWHLEVAKLFVGGGAENCTSRSPVALADGVSDPHLSYLGVRAILQQLRFNKAAVFSEATIKDEDQVKRRSQTTHELQLGFHCIKGTGRRCCEACEPILAFPHQVHAQEESSVSLVQGTFERCSRAFLIGRLDAGCCARCWSGSDLAQSLAGCGCLRKNLPSLL